MSVKLYEENAYIKSFNATVTECIPYKEKFLVALNKTAFFPEGGGQSADTGFLDNATVTDVQEKNGTIYHETGTPLNVGKEVSGKIDWAQRFYRMQNHTGEHLTSGIIHTLFGYDNVGFHMGHNSITLDTSGVLTKEDIENIEEKVNAAIYENVNVKAYFPSESELKNISYRSKLDNFEKTRIVEIEGYDICACCAPHVSKTGEIGIMKILDFYPNKGGTRIELLCGHSALEDYRKKTSANAEIMGLLSAPNGQTTDFVKHTLEALSNAKFEIKALKEELALAKLETQKAGIVTVGHIKNANFDDLKVCMNFLTSSNDGICAVISQTEKNCLFIVSSQTKDISNFMKYLRDNLNACGGGKNNYSQGKISADYENIIQVIKEYRE